MKKMIPYKKGYSIEPNSYKLRSGGWVPRAWIVRDTGDRIWMGPVYSKTKTYPTQGEANKYAIGLGRAWIDKNG